MVHMYTRVNNFCDVIMRETSSAFEVEARYRDNIIKPFPPGAGMAFPKSEDDAERNAVVAYNKLLEVVTEKDK